MTDDNSLEAPSCWDACCRPARPADEFIDTNVSVGTSNKAILDLLRYNQAGIVFIIIVGLAIVVTWLVFSVVPGFARFDGDPLETSAVSHIGWWIPIEVITLVIGGLSVFISFQYNRDQRIEASISKLRGWLVFYIVMLAVAIAANLVHLSLSALELSYCTSTLCVSHKGFLLVLLVFLVTLAVLEAWAIYRVVTYSTNLKNAFVLNDTIGKDVVFKTISDYANEPLIPRKIEAPIMRVQPQRVPMNEYSAERPQQQQQQPRRTPSRGRHGIKNK